MTTNDLFVNGRNLPMPLTKQEVYELLRKIKTGDNLAREKLVLHNIRFVLYQVTHKFKAVNYDPKELVAIGNVGLLKAIDSFDVSKNVEFATYTVKCIDNEILMFLRKLKKDNIFVGLDTISDIDDNTDLEFDYMEKEIKQIVKNLVEELPKQEQDLIIMYFGFDEHKYSLIELSEKYNIHFTSVAKRIKKTVNKLTNELKKQGIIEEKKGKVKQKDTNH